MGFKLICFDLDGCLTDKDDSWLFIHHHLGVWEQAKEHRKLFFNGEIDYQRWADLDVGLWKGTSIKKLNEIIQQISVRPHIDKVVQELKKYNLILIILSSGLSFFADSIKEKYNFDFAIANSPEISHDGELTGNIEVKVSYDDKHLVLQDFLSSLSIKLEECIAIGDGENDIPLFKEVGYSIAFNPNNEKIANAASIAVKNGNLLDVLSIIRTKLS
ncbi:MAG TPA: HAD family phosphatase [Candidatus Deferrimicrobium sp.]|nr:HAD family phosphatase [Candidatus Deferrimicrobium sp.]